MAGPLPPGSVGLANARALGLSCAGMVLASRISRCPAVLLFLDDQTKLTTSSDFTEDKAFG